MQYFQDQGQGYGQSHSHSHNQGQCQGQYWYLDLGHVEGEIQHQHPLDSRCNVGEIL